MAVSTLMVLGNKALTANYAALQTTGHNIANASVKGFSRQQAELSTAAGQFTGSGYMGAGVNVSTVSRAHNVFLTREASAASSLSAMDGARVAQLGRLENVFKTGEAGLGHAATQFLNSFSDLANRPGDIALRQVVLGRASEVASRFAEAGRSLDDIQANLRSEMQASVSEINQLSSGIAAINRQMVGLQSLGQPPNDLLDERDRLLGRLGDMVQITRIDSSDGTVGVFVGGGQRLVLGASATTLSLQQDRADPGRSVLALREGTVERQLGDNLMGGGRLAGLLRFQNEDLVDARNLIGRLAAVVGESVNAQQAMGVSLRSNPGEAPPPFFRMGAPQALADARNARGPNGLPLAVVTLAISDPTALKPSDYRLEADPDNAGQWLLTRLVAGRPSGDPVDRISFAGPEIEFQGMTVRLPDPAPAATDRFLLQAVGRAANGMAGLLENPMDVAAASALVASTGAANAGTAGIAELRFGAALPPQPGATARISFTSDSGDYDWQLVDAGANLISSGSGTWTPGQPLPPAGNDINGFTLQLSGVPRSGDTLTVQPTPAAALGSNNGNALLLTGLRDAELSEGRNLTDLYALALSEVGVRVQAARTSANISTAVAQQTEAARGGQAGVNLDEEAARLIIYQQSYQAAAKVLQVAQSLLDTVLQVTGR